MTNGKYPIHDLEELLTLPDKPKLVRFKDERGVRWYSHPEDVEHPENWYASVTAIIGVAVHEKLKNYFQEAPIEVQKEKLEKAISSGDAIHEAIQADLQGKPWNASNSLLIKPMLKWSELREAHAIKADYCELSVYSPTWGFAGTIDIRGSYEGLPAILDIKSGFYSVKAGWQMGGYKLALEEQLMPDVKNFDMVGLNIRSDGSKADVFKYSHFDWCRDTFLAALQVWKALYYTRLNIQRWRYLHKPEWRIELKCTA